ncbi:MAG: terminase gpA endonuclease subunit [Alphaproteobacteria bacterium]
MAAILTPDELSRLQSLSESELTEFLSSLPDDVLPIVAAEIDGLQFQDNYASDRSRRNAEVINAKTAAAQEVGPLPPVANQTRRDRCKQDLLDFALTYFKSTFYIELAPYQVAMFERFQAVILGGGREAHAVRRGGLKSTCARVAAIWAAVYGHRRFLVLTGATDDKASEHRENFFNLLASSDMLAQDFPEVVPLILKSKQPKRQFRLNGKLLTLHAKDDRGRIVFPDIPGSESSQVHVAPFSLMATDVSGLSYIQNDGRVIRPDLIIFDDVQTPQSSSSPSQTDEREDLITKTFMGLAGLGVEMATVMVCTVRAHQDLTERFMDRKRHPDWHGKVWKSVLRMPERMDLWDRYAALLGTGETPKEGKAAAQEFYARNRADMDAGAKVAWEHDKLPEELSALQSLLTIRAVDPEFFQREIQQEGGVVADKSGVRLDSQALLPRLSQVERSRIPQQASYTTAFIDSSDQVLWYMVCSWERDFSGCIVDYGTWPDQGRPVFYKSDLARRLSQDKPGVSWEEAFVHAHNCLEADLLQRFPQLDLILKDWSDGEQKPRIQSQVLASANRTRIRPSKGFGPKPGRKPVHLWGEPQKDRQTGQYWVERRADHPVHVQYDANIWKSHAARRLLTTPGAPSAVLLPGTDERANRLLVEHLTAEIPKAISYDGAHGVAWEQTPGRDNDWWDCFVGCNVAASICGVGVANERTGSKQRRTFALPGGVRG